MIQHYCTAIVTVFDVAPPMVSTTAGPFPIELVVNSAGVAGRAKTSRDAPPKEAISICYDFT